MQKTARGPPPRLDLSKKGLEDLSGLDFVKGGALSSSTVIPIDNSAEDNEEDTNLSDSTKIKLNEGQEVNSTPSTPELPHDEEKKRVKSSTVSNKLSSSVGSPVSPRKSTIGVIKASSEEIQTLILSSNKLKSLPMDFGVRFEELRALYLDHNQIEEFPVAVCQLLHLEKVHLEYNLIEKIPKEVQNWKICLKKLYIHNNKLTELPDELGELSALEVLDIHNNNIRVLPPHLAGSTRLQEFSIYNNPILSPPPFIYNKGIIHLLRYMREIRESLLEITPKDDFIFTRKISFLEGKGKMKRSPSVKVLTRSQSAIVDQKSTKALNAQMRKGETTFREFVDDSVFINQNSLVYYLTDYHSHETCGRREYMEDRCIALPRLRQHKPKEMLEEVINMFSKVGFFAVYDGHGGDRAADYLIANLHKNICNQPAFAKGEFEKAIRSGFKTTDEGFLQLCREHGFIDGTTALVVLLIDNKLICAHAGDSRAVLCRDKKAIRLSEDHKPDRVDELARIEEMGGEVLFRGNCFRVAGDLAMSRSFGDLRLKEPRPMVICDPEIRVEELTPKDEFVILASDGLWDVLSDQRACDIARKCGSTEEAARKLVETALALGTMDNTTAIVVKLDWCLDFITQDEIEGKVDPPKQKKKEDKKDEKVQQEISSHPSRSFRSTLENFSAESQAPKGVYPEVSSSSSAIKLKVLIPDLNATKLMKFDTSTPIKEIRRAIVAKHRFTEGVEMFEIYAPGKTLLDPETTLSQTDLKDMDQIEIRKIGAPPNEQPAEPEDSTINYSEALPPGTQDVNNNNNSNHRLEKKATSLWIETHKAEKNEVSQKEGTGDSGPWKQGTYDPQTPRRATATANLPKPSAEVFIAPPKEEKKLEEPAETTLPTTEENVTVEQEQQQPLDQVQELPTDSEQQPSDTNQ